MYNPMGFGQQPVRTSYNMLFAHFKRQGYSDELAGAEANRLMLQTYPSYQIQSGQQNQTYQPQNFNSYQLPSKQTPQKVHQQTSQVNTTSIDRMSLLSGVKISSKPAATSVGWKIPVMATVSDAAKNSTKNTIPIMLKASKDNIVENKIRVMSFNEPKVAATPSAMTNVKKIVKVPEAFSKDIFLDVNPATSSTGSDSNPTFGTEDRPTMDEINAWILRLYSQHSITKCSKASRFKVSNYVEGIVKKFRNGNLTRGDLVTPTAEELFGKPMEEEFKDEKSDKKKDVIVDSLSVPKSLSMPPVKQPPVEFGKSKAAEKKLNSWKKNSAKRGVLKSPGIDGGVLVQNLAENEIQRREQRSQRFKAKAASVVTVYNMNPSKGVEIVGTSEALEKPYLRLTAEPNPATVRPEVVLRKSFKHVFDRFMENLNYRYLEEQLRSIRQDIQVQHLRTPFVVKLYSTNARIALLYGDLDQFNQCQTQLINLHRKISGFEVSSREFECYCLLYLSLQQMKMDILRYLTQSSCLKRLKNAPHLRYANAVRVALSESNFVRYFQLADTSGIDKDALLRDIYQEAFNTDDFTEAPSESCKRWLNGENVTIDKPPFYSKLLFKMFEPRFRMIALVTMARSALTISPTTIAKVLGFQHDQCIDFLNENNAVYNEAGLVDCKRSLPHLLESPLLSNKKI